MKKWVVGSIVLLGLLCLVAHAYAQGQKPMRTLTILYCNNLNAEIEPCPS